MKLERSSKADLLLESILFGAILLLALALRAYRLGYWGLEGDEHNTLRDSLTTSSLTGPKPLLFLLNYYLLKSWTPLNELTLRLFPAIFGIASVGAVYWFARRTISPVTALIAAALVTLDPTHLFWSQYARYYSLAYLLMVLSALASYLAVCNHNVRWYLLALLLLTLGWFAHPPTGLVAAAIAAWTLWQLANAKREEIDTNNPKSRYILSLIILSAIILAASLAWWPMLRSWYQRGSGWHYDWVFLTLGHIDAVSPGMTVCGLLGMWSLWMARRQRIATLLAAIAFIPLLTALVLSNWFAVSHGYLFASTFVFPVGAAYVLDQLAFGYKDSIDRRLAAVVILVLLMAEAAPRIWSQYCDGGRPDFRAASYLVAQRVGPHDEILADQPNTVAYYTENVPVNRLHRDPVRLTKAWHELSDAYPGARLWIITEFQSRGGFNDRNLGHATEWVNANCRIVASFASSRLDYKHNEARVYLVDPYPGEQDRAPASGENDGT